MRVLMAEDDPVSRLVLQSTLKKWGYDPIVANDGREALNVLMSETPPDIAILDWMMPEVDGVEICRLVRSRIPSIPIYIILLTAKSQRDDLVSGLAAGADDYVTKPFNSQELMARFQAGVRVVGLQQELAGRAHDLETALARLQQMQQGQKLEALGRMSSGIAHEINTPIQYIGDNIRFFQESWSHVAPVLQNVKDDSDIDYFVREVPKALDESLQGTQKIAKIVRAMRDFSHTKGEKSAMDLNQAIETTLEVSRSEWKYVASVETDLDPELPPVICMAAEIHQALLHLIVNAAHAMADVKALTGATGVLRIATSRDGNDIEIRIGDTGSGIPEEIRSKIFEPFFTTKDVGKGSGQGLAVVYASVMQQHGGSIRFESESGKGTTFIVRLPIDGPKGSCNERKEAHSVR